MLITTDIKEAQKRLIKNELVVIPTETVYGLAANAYHEEAVRKIFELKKRPSYNPLIVHIKSIDYLHEVAQDIPPMAMLLAEKFWPGSLTLVLNKKAHIPDIVTAGKETVAVRMPNHPMTLELLRQLDFPLAAPSANPFGSISPTNAQHVDQYFKEASGIILDGGACENGLESTIIGFENNQPILYRHGSISVEEIEQVIGEIVVNTHNNTTPNAPGMLTKHYAPKTETILTDRVNDKIGLYENKKIGVLVFKTELSNRNIAKQIVLSEKGNMKEAARNLYAALHLLDSSNLDIIIVEVFPKNGLGNTINDRLQRAVRK